MCALIYVRGVHSLLMHARYTTISTATNLNLLTARTHAARTDSRHFSILLSSAAFFPFTPLYYLSSWFTSTVSIFRNKRRQNREHLLNLEFFKVAASYGSRYGFDRQFSKLRIILAGKLSRESESSESFEIFISENFLDSAKGSFHRRYTFSESIMFL